MVHRACQAVALAKADGQSRPDTPFAWRQHAKPVLLGKALNHPNYKKRESVGELLLEHRFETELSVASLANSVRLIKGLPKPG